MNKLGYLLLIGLMIGCTTTREYTSNDQFNNHSLIHHSEMLCHDGGNPKWIRADSYVNLYNGTSSVTISYQCHEEVWRELQPSVVNIKRFLNGKLPNTGDERMDNK